MAVPFVVGGAPLHVINLAAGGDHTSFADPAPRMQVDWGRRPPLPELLARADHLRAGYGRASWAHTHLPVCTGCTPQASDRAWTSSRQRPPTSRYWGIR